MTSLPRPRALLVPRQLHPGAWWLWALGLAAVATRTSNLVLLALVLAVAGYVVAARRTEAPWARSYIVFLRLGLVVLTIRMVAQLVFGAPQGDTLLVTLPRVDPPEWFAGMTIGGPVTLEMVVAALSDGLRIATILACVGAANALANPKRLLASLPAALYEVGVAVVVALSFAPSMIDSVRRVRGARRLRGRADRGVRSIVAVAMPVLEDALERSVSLAAAMDSRGYGRRAEVPAAVRRTTALLTLVGLSGLCLGAYNALDAGGHPWLGGPALLLGVLAAVAGIRLGGRRAIRSRYRPDRFAWPEWTTAAVGVTAAVATFVGGSLDPAALRPSAVPLVAPPLPLVPTLGILLALLPAWATPEPTGPRRDLPDAVADPAAPEVEVPA